MDNRLHHIDPVTGPAPTDLSDSLDLRLLPEQVDGWVGGSTVQLTEDDLAEIATAAIRTGAGTGPVHTLVAA